MISVCKIEQPFCKKDPDPVKNGEDPQPPCHYDRILEMLQQGKAASTKMNTGILFIYENILGYFS